MRWRCPEHLNPTVLGLVGASSPPGSSVVSNQLGYRALGCSKLHEQKKFELVYRYESRCNRVRYDIWKEVCTVADADRDSVSCDLDREWVNLRRAAFRAGRLT